MSVTSTLSSLSGSALPATLSSLHGAGLVFIRYKQPTPSAISFLSSGDSAVGFWYETTVSCQPQINVIPLTGPSSESPWSKPLRLADLYADPNVSAIRILKLRQVTSENLFRSIIYSTLMNHLANPQATPSHLHQVLEKLVVASEAPLLDYLRMITILSSNSPCSENTSTNPYLANTIHQSDSLNIDMKINQAIALLRPYLKKNSLPVPPTTNGRLLTPSTVASELEQHLFEVVAVVNK